MARELDEYKAVDFYRRHGGTTENGFTKFSEGGRYYFCRFVDGKPAILSQAYVAARGRDNGIASVTKNSKIADRFRFEDRDGGRHGFALFAGNRQEIGISPDYRSRAEAERVAGRMSGAVKAAAKTKAKKKTAAPKRATAKKKTTTKTSAAAFTGGDGRRGNYRPLDFYRTHGGTTRNGFDRFEKDGAYYFSYRKDGDIVLLSEAYTSAAGRDNGIKSVTKNRPIEARYKHRTHRNGKHYFDLVAGNHQEIATSVWYDSDPAAKRGAADLRGHSAGGSSTSRKTATKTKTSRKAKTGAAALAAGGVAGAALASKRDEDNYQSLAFYKAGAKGKSDGIESFTGKDGAHYFVVRENGKIRMVSESYPTTAARDRGADSVRKNIRIEKRYDFTKRGIDGKDGFALRAGNNKEIARSVGFGSAAAAATGAAYLMGTRKRAAAKPKPKAKPKASTAKAAGAAGLAAGATSAAAAKPKAKPKAKPAPKPKPAAKAAPKPTPKPKSAAPIAAAGLAATGAAAAAASGASKAPHDKTDDYLACEAYEGHQVTDPVNRTALFTHSDGKHYFVFYDDDGDVRWRSEGFTTTAARQEELDLALRLHRNPDNIKRLERGERYSDLLHDDNGREIARSCLCTARPIVAAAPVAAAAAAPIAAAAAAGAGAMGVAKGAAGAATGAVAGATGAATAATGGAGIWGWLKWVLIGLLGLLAIWLLSKCWGGEKPDLPTASTPSAQATMVTCWDGSKAEDNAACPASQTCSDGSVIAASASCPVVEVSCWDGSTAATRAECPASVRCWDGSRAANLDACPASVECWDGSQMASQADCPAKPEAKPAAPATNAVPTNTARGVRGSSTRSTAINRSGVSPFFATNACPAYKRVTRLGSNPEFGDSHGLTPAQFYDKLAARHAADRYDRNYLDALFRALGYAGGFADADASMFSEATVQSGTRGLLGFGQQHALQCSTLVPTSDRDLAAFRVRAANGQDVYFMKTCGNYFYAE